MQRRKKLSLVQTFTVQQQETFDRQPNKTEEDVGERETDRVRKSWRTVVERFSSRTSCLYSRRLLKQTCTSQEGKLSWLIIPLDVCIISHICSKYAWENPQFQTSIRLLLGRGYIYIYALKHAHITTNAQWKYYSQRPSSSSSWKKLKKSKFSQLLSQKNDFGNVNYFFFAHFFTSRFNQIWCQLVKNCYAF